MQEKGQPVTTCCIKVVGFPPTHSFEIVSREEIIITNLSCAGVKLSPHYDLCVVTPPFHYLVLRLNKFSDV